MDIVSWLLSHFNIIFSRLKKKKKIASLSKGQKKMAGKNLQRICFVSGFNFYSDFSSVIFLKIIF